MSYYKEVWHTKTNTQLYVIRKPYMNEYFHEWFQLHYLKKILINDSFNGAL